MPDSESEFQTEFQKGVEKMAEAFEAFGTAASIALTDFANNLSQICDAIAKAYSDYYDFGTKSNNWLKLHGYPMRRKRAKR